MVAYGIFFVCGGKCCRVCVGCCPIKIMTSDSAKKIVLTNLWFIKDYVTVPEKRVLVAQIMIFLYRRFSATTPKNNSRDKTFVFVSGVSPTRCLHSR